MDPVGDDRGKLFVAELDAPAETTKVVEAEKDGDTPEETPDESNGATGPAELASDATNGGGGTTDGEAKDAGATLP
jgi:hypothetical protein